MCQMFHWSQSMLWLDLDDTIKKKGHCTHQAWFVAPLIAYGEEWNFHPSLLSSLHGTWKFASQIL